MKIKTWVISSLLLLAALTGLAQSYHQVITRSLDSDLNEKKVTTEAKKGTILVSQNHVRVDNITYKLIEKYEEQTSKDFRYIHYIIWNSQDKSQRTYSCVLSYDLKSSKLLMLEIWKSRFNCIYYVLTQNRPTTSLSNTQFSTQQSAGLGVNYHHRR